MKKSSIFILIGLLPLLGCLQKEELKVEVRGEIAHLGQGKLQITYVNTKNQISFDTVSSGKKGTFSFKIQTHQTLSPIKIYFVEGKCWTTLFANPGDNIRIRGDLAYVDLLSIRGGFVNNDLDRFKNKIRALYKERLDILATNKLPEEKNQLRLAEINKLLKRAAKDFILENRSSIASVVLIQDFFYQDYDLETLDLLTALEGDAKNCKMAVKMLDGINKWGIL